MVIVGKSTGGQAAKMLVQSSGTTLWNAVFAQPIDQVHASPTLQRELAAAFFFEPEPYVQRVVFITTGHRGSQRARRTGLRLGAGLIRRDNPLHAAWAELLATNGPRVFQPSFRDRALTSSDGIEADSRLLEILSTLPLSPRVVSHSIIADIHHDHDPAKISDGFIDYHSAHLDGAASETIVTGTHLCEANPEVIAEVRRILHQHVNALKTISRRLPPVLDAKAQNFPLPFISACPSMTSLTEPF
jgi:hypothetical protein